MGEALGELLVGLLEGLIELAGAILEAIFTSKDDRR